MFRPWIAVAALAMSALAQTIAPANFTNEDNIADRALMLKVSMGDDMVPQTQVLPLVDSARNVPPPGLDGTLFRADPASALDFESGNITLISCDEYNGNIDAADLLESAEEANVTAVLFYSETSDGCSLKDYNGSLGGIYSTTDRRDTEKLLKDVEPPTPTRGDELYGSIENSGSDDSNASNQDEQQNDQNDQGGPGTLNNTPGTTVAMIILYSVTGIIAAIFLAIIITGACRAHRHPERYGPRHVVGRPRRSRARGIARAMVDSLPIVKVGERQDDKPADVELAENRSSTGRAAESEGEGSRTGEEREGNEGRQEQTSTAAAAPEAGISAATSQSENHHASGVNAASNDNPDDNPDDNQGCSICAEDFEHGQDQRVLPCDHRFHPECVDPWLLNVSGTCPLCRIDLNPAASGTSAENAENEEPTVPPPVAQPPRPRRRDFVRSLLGPQAVPRDRRADEAAATPQHQQTSVVTEDDTRRGRRLRRLLGVRTRRTGDEGPLRAEVAEGAEDVATAANGEASAR